jgi:microcystin degradation protein MlrC
MRTLEAMARGMEEENPDLLAVNIHAGFSFADTPDTGVSFTVNTLGDAAAARRCLDELCQAALRLPTAPPNPEVSVAEAMARLATFDAGPVLLVEPSDNIGAGAPGEGVALLKALIAHGIDNAGVIVNDPAAVAELAGLTPGDRRTLDLGAKSSPLYGEGCTLECELLSRSDGRFRLEDSHSHMASMLGSNVEMGPCALVRHSGVLILLTSRPTAPFDLAQWRSQGVAPENLFAIGVKAAVAHRRAYDPIAQATIYVATPGPCATDLRTLPYRHVRRPVWPLDDL